jgi:RNA polymerase sigma factor (sigma-70 family)
MSSQLAVDPTAPSDAELIARVRGGDMHAYGDLFERHREAATRLARQLVPQADADDLVSEAFMKVYRVLNEGGGPDVAFRPYLLTAVRRLNVDKVRASSRVTPSDEIERFDPGVPFADPAVADFENSAAARAFATLPERWQMVLWHLEVEGQKPADIAPLLGMSANSVSALAYRAREGLRQAYLQMHLADTAAENCRWVTERLGAHVRGGLSKRDAAKVDEHLDECPRCAAVYLELAEVNSNLRGIVAPLLLGAAATGYLSSTGGGVGVAALGAWIWRVKETIQGNLVASAGVAASTVAVIGAAAAVIGFTGDGGKEPVSGVVIESPDPGSGPGAPLTTESTTSPAASVTFDPTLPGRSTTASPSESTGPSVAAPTTVAPSAGSTPPTVPGTGQPTTDMTSPATELPTSGATTDLPGSGPTTDAPTTDVPSSGPTTGPPTSAPTTEPPTSGPTTEPPTSGPTTEPPTTAPTTEPPTTIPTTEPPTTTPTTEPPTTTTPTSPTTTSTPPPVPDLSLAPLQVAQSGINYTFTVTVAGIPDQVTPTVTLTVERSLGIHMRGDDGWSCDVAVSADRRMYACTAATPVTGGTTSWHPRLHYHFWTDVWLQATVADTLGGDTNDTQTYPPGQPGPTVSGSPGGPARRTLDFGIDGTE